MKRARRREGLVVALRREGVFGSVSREELIFEILRGALEIPCDVPQFAGNPGKPPAAEQNQDGRQDD